MKFDIIISGDISTASFGEFAEEFHKLSLEHDGRLGYPITIKICTEGGSALAALAYYDLIRNANCTVVMVGTGIIASAAALIFAAAHRRYMTPSSWFMVHDDGCEDVVNLRLGEGEKKLKHQRRLENQWNELMAQAINGTSAAEWDAWHRQEVYFTAQECLSNGFIDGIIKGDKIYEKD